MYENLIHYGVKGMKWKNHKQPDAKKPIPQVVRPIQIPMGTLGARIGGTGTLGAKIESPSQPWTMSPESKALNRAKMAEIAALFQKKPPVMQQKFSAVKDKTLNPEQQKAVDDFLKKRGIA